MVAKFIVSRRTAKGAAFLQQANLPHGQFSLTMDRYQALQFDQLDDANAAQAALSAAVGIAYVVEAVEG